MSFFTIFVADGLSDRGYKRALASGPTFVSSRGRDHKEMLRAAGFRQVDEIDLTAEFLATSRAWVTERRKREAELIAVEGKEAFLERQEDNETQSSAIEAGLLRRAMFICR
jgi:hypothetical protein